MNSVGPHAISVCEASLYAHNFARLNHEDTLPLIYNDQLARLSEEYAVYLANNYTFTLIEYRVDIRENIFFGYPSSAPEMEVVSMAQVVSTW